MKRTAPVFLFAVLVAVFGFQVRSADAYSQYSVNKDATNCRACHGDFRASNYTSLSDSQSWGNLHDLHRNTMLGGDCETCHSSGGRFPVILDSSVGGTGGLQAISCVGCHGRAEDEASPNAGYGAGLRQHHWRAGEKVCAGCHSDANPANYTPVGEDVLPPYYANPGTGHPNMPTDPCNLDGNEDFAGSAEGLDNDGDNIYDGADPDCQAADTTPPTVASTVPGNNATGVAVTTTVSATFDEAIDGTTVDGTSYFVTDGVANVVGTLNVVGSTATFTPSADLAAATVYTATLTTAVTDLAGNPLAADYTWSFTTGSGADTTPPKVLSTVPGNNATNVAFNTLVTATFSEAIDSTTVDGTSFFVSDGGGNVVGTISVSPDNTMATFTSSANLAAATVYTATLTTAVTDLALNPLAANYTWSFTTGAGADTTPPTVLSTVPDNNATGVAVTTNISATFSEPIDPASVDGFVTDGVDNVVGTINVAGSTATFDPTAALADNTVYTATLTAATDLAGNPLAGDYTWSFTTGVTTSSSGGGSSSGCSVMGSGSNEGGGAVLFLTLLAILFNLRRQKAKARR